jgi:hypothetical protein
MPIVGIDDIDDLSVGRGCTIRHIGYDLRRPNAVPLSRNRSSGRLGSLSVNVFSVANFDDVDQKFLIVDGIQDTIVTLSHPVPVEVT